MSITYKGKCLNLSHTVQTHICRERAAIHQQLSVTLCQTKPVRFSGFTGLQCPRCKCSTATTLHVKKNAKFYPDDIDPAGALTLFLFPVVLAPRQFVKQRFLLTACYPQISGHHRSHVPKLDNLVSARGEQISSGGLVVHVNNAVLAVVEGGCGCSILVTDGLVAAVTHAHLELEPHEGDGGAFGRTFAAHCLAALPAVVLP